MEGPPRDLRRRQETDAQAAESSRKIQTRFTPLSPASPQLTLRVRARSPVQYVNNYFRARVRAPFTSPLSANFDFVAEPPTRRGAVVRSDPRAQRVDFFGL